jgi:hypothetical protein
MGAYRNLFDAENIAKCISRKRVRRKERDEAQALLAFHFASWTFNPGSKLTNSDAIPHKS